MPEGDLARSDAAEHRRGLLWFATIACLLLGAFAAGHLAVSNLLITRNLYGEPLGASPDEVRAFPVNATVCLLLLVAGTVLGAVGRRPGAVLAGVLLLLLGVLVVHAVGTELGVWSVDASASDPAPEVQRPICRSGGDGDDCPGG